MLTSSPLPRNGATASAGPPAPPPQAQTTTAVPFSYPSVDPGFPPLGLEQLLGAHGELLARIKICYGADRETFDRDVLTLVRRYAAFVHLLPATPANYFNEPGGLLRLGLETAFFALQGTDAHIFSGRASISTRRHLEPRWRLATFIAGLCAEIHRTLGQVIVTDHDGNEWQPYLQGLHPWLAERAVSRYYLKWLSNTVDSPGLALFALPLIVPASTLQHLAQGNTVVVPHMMASLSGMPLYREHNILGELVRRAAALVIDRFLQASADRYGKPQLGSHLERYLIDALRRLVATHPAWTPNAERSRVWYGPDGLFIVWPNAAADLRKLLETDQLPGIPKSPETMLEILLGAGVFEARTAQQPLWSITPPGAKAAQEVVKLAQPDIVLAGIEPRPEALADPLSSPPSAEKAQASPPSASGSTAPAHPPAKDAPPTAGRNGIPASDPPAMAREPLAPAPWQLELPVSAGAAPAPAPARAEAAADLLGPGHGADDRTAQEPTPEAAPAAPALTPPRLKLEAPMRLTSRVRAALADIVEALNGNGEPPLARATARGLAIALVEFERRHIEPSAALRALFEARMLVVGPQGKSPTSNQDLSGQTCLTLTVAPSFLTGLPVADDARSQEG
ncbi:MAG: MobH family relaxase [Acidovorax sp.]